MLTNGALGSRARATRGRDPAGTARRRGVVVHDGADARVACPRDRRAGRDAVVHVLGVGACGRVERRHAPLRRVRSRVVPGLARRCPSPRLDGARRVARDPRVRRAVLARGRARTSRARSASRWCSTPPTRSARCTPACPSVGSATRRCSASRRRSRWSRAKAVSWRPPATTWRTRSASVATTPTRATTTPSSSASTVGCRRCTRRPRSRRWRPSPRTRPGASRSSTGTAGRWPRCPGVRVQAVAAGDRSTWKDFTIAVDAATYGVDRDTPPAGARCRRRRHPHLFRSAGPPPDRVSGTERVRLGRGLPVTDAAAARVLSLPVYPALDDRAVDGIVRLIATVHDKSGELARSLPV